MNLPRSSFYDCPKSPENPPEEEVLTDRIEEIAEEFPRFGYRKVTAQHARKKVGGQETPSIRQDHPTAIIPIPSIRT